MPLSPQVQQLSRRAVVLGGTVRHCSIGRPAVADTACHDHVAAYIICPCSCSVVVQQSGMFRCIKDGCTSSIDVLLHQSSCRFCQHPIESSVCDCNWLVAKFTALLDPAQLLWRQKIIAMHNLCRQGITDLATTLAANVVDRTTS